MIDLAILVVITGLACSNLSHVLTEVDLFQKIRDVLGKIPVVGKVFTCKFCQSNWMALLAAIYISMEMWNAPTFGSGIPLLAKIIILWQAMHWVARKGHKIEDPIPLSMVASANVNVTEQGPDS